MSKPFRFCSGSLRITERNAKSSTCKEMSMSELWKRKAKVKKNKQIPNHRIMQLSENDKSSTNVPWNILNHASPDTLIPYPLKTHISMIQLILPSQPFPTCIPHLPPEHTPSCSTVHHSHTTHHTRLMRCIKIVSWGVICTPRISLQGRKWKEINGCNDTVIEGVTCRDTGIPSWSEDARSRWIDDEGCNRKIMRWFRLKEIRPLRKPNDSRHKPFHLSKFRGKAVSDPPASTYRTGKEGTSWLLDGFWLARAPRMNGIVPKYRVGIYSRGPILDGEGGPRRCVSRGGQQVLGDRYFGHRIRRLRWWMDHLEFRGNVESDGDGECRRRRGYRWELDMYG